MSERVREREPGAYTRGFRVYDGAERLMRGVSNEKAADALVKVEAHEGDVELLCNELDVDGDAYHPVFDEGPYEYVVRGLVRPTGCINDLYAIQGARLSPSFFCAASRPACPLAYT